MNHTKSNLGEPLFSDIAPAYLYEQVANFFGPACTELFSLYCLENGAFWGEASMFSYGEAYFFDGIFENGNVHIVHLDLVNEVLE